MNKIHSKKLFLVDSIGALLSAILIGLVLARFEPIFGMPHTVLYVLAVIPCIFSIYSFLCFLSKKRNLQSLMKIIAIANLLYCCLTVGLMIYFYQQLTIFGLIYFVLEIIIVVLLAIIEWIKSIDNQNFTLWKRCFFYSFFSAQQEIFMHRNTKISQCGIPICPMSKGSQI